MIRDVYFGELSVHEIAIRDGLSKDTLRSRLKRARSLLRKDLASLGTELDEDWVVALIPLASIHGPTGNAAAIASPVASTSLSNVVSGKVVLLAGLLAALTMGGMAWALRTPLQPDPVHSIELSKAPENERAKVPGGKSEQMDRVAAESLRMPAVTAPAGVDAFPTTTISGRVVDQDRMALPNALVEIGRGIHWKPWAKAKELTLEPNTMGFSVQAVEDGRFQLTLPFDGRADGFLRAQSDTFHEIGFLDFRPGRQEALGLQIAEGSVEVGDLVLARAGLVRGRVVDSSGKAILSATVAIGPGFGASYALHHAGFAVMHSDGSFEISHAPVGGRGLKIQAEGFVSRFMEFVPIESSRATDVGSITLERAGSLSGMVLDSDGRPICDATIQAYTEAINGDRASIQTDEQGRFHLQLRALGPHRLVVAPSGFEPFGDDPKTAEFFSPGSKDVVIRLSQRTQMTFRVIDAFTEEPVETYELRVISKGGSGSEKPRSAYTSKLDFRQHRRGQSTLAAVEGIDLVIVKSPQHPTYRADVARDKADSKDLVQTIRLTRGVSIRGQCVYRGKALPGTLININGYEGPNHERFAIEYDTVADAKGDFELNGFGPGVFDFSFVHPQRPLVRAKRLKVDIEEDGAGGSVLLETVELGDEGIIRGQVLTPPGVDPGGLRVMVQPWQEGLVETVDSSGRFHFQSVPSGSVSLSVEGQEGILYTSRKTLVEVSPGGAADATIDMRDCGTGKLALQMTAHNVETDRIRLRVSHEALKVPSERYFQSGILRFLPQPDEDNWIRAEVRASGLAHLEVSVDRGVRWLLASPELDLRHGERTVAKVEIELGSLELTIPEHCHFADGDRLDIDFTLPAFPHRPTHLIINAELGLAAKGSSWLPSGTLVREKSISIPGIPIGSYDVTVQLNFLTSEALTGRPEVVSEETRQIELR